MVSRLMRMSLGWATAMAATALAGWTLDNAGFPGAAVALEATARAPSSAECLSCHRGLQRGGHPMDVRPVDASPPVGWPLDGLGRMSCLTCHTNCGRKEGREALATRDDEPAAGSGAALRGELSDGAFCAQCHGRSGVTQAPGEARAARQSPPGERHAAYLALAHPMEGGSEAGSAETTDAASRRCLWCHDGTVSGAADVALGSNLDVAPQLGGAKRSHPIGVVYPPRPSPYREGGYVPAGSLDPRILLPDGRVGCLSCHDLFSSEESLLSMPNRGSALCDACHEI